MRFPAEDNTTQVIKVPVWGDRTDEPDYQFKVNLSNALHARIGRAQATATVVDNDPIPTLDIQDYVDLDYVTIDGVSMYNGKQAKVTITTEEYW